MTATNPTTVVVVDDEPKARRLLCDWVESDAHLRLVGEAGDGRTAIDVVRARRPDVLLLDVQLPEVDGFGVLRSLAGDRLPVVVFVTAFDEHAIRAFEHNAIDFMLKPIDRPRFNGAIARARRQVALLEREDLESRLLALLSQAESAPRERPSYVDRITVRIDGRMLLLAVRDIDWIEADHNQLRLHVGRDVYTIRDTMGAMQARLDPADFVRVHRSVVVNVARIREIQPWFHGDFVVILRDGTKIRSSRSCRANLRRLLGREDRGR